MRALAMRPCSPMLPTRSQRIWPTFFLRHVGRLGDNDLVNNETDYSGVDALAASLATNEKLRVLGCARHCCANTFPLNTHVARSTRPPFRCVDYLRFVLGGGAPSLA